jgi:hypothetical protein
MTNRTGFWGLGLAMLCAAMSGCVVPCGYNCNAGGRACAVADPCAPCGATSAGACNAGGCETGCWNFPVLTALHNMFTCNAGCGRTYWGEWCYDPPEPCEPCNDHGDWVGAQCCSPRGCFNICHLFCSRRLHAPCESATCTECAAGAETGCCGAADPAVEGDVLDGQWTETMESLDAVPNGPAAQPVEPLPGVSKRAPARNPNSRLVRRNQAPVVH